MQFCIWFAFLVGVVCGAPPKFPIGSEPGLWEGDIKLNDKQKKDVDRILEKKGTSTFGLTNVYPPWTNGVVVYEFAPSIANNPAKNRGIYAAMREWTTKTSNCITFRRRRPNEKNYLQFFVGNGCWGHLGMPNGRSQISVGAGCEGQNVMAHEIGHALGFWHEQSRTDRDSYLQILWENVPNAFREAFEKYGRDKIDSLGVPYDYTSIMHYPWNAFSTTGRDTVRPLRKVPSPGPYVHVSALDVIQARLFYKCDAKPPVTKQPPVTRQPPVTKCVTETREVSVNTRDASCFDRSTSCASWASRGECGRNPGYMRPNCKKSCNLCGSSSCVDNSGNCAYWARSGQCQANPGYMNVNCRKSCKLCTKVVTSKRCYTLPPQTTTSEPLTPPIPSTTQGPPPIPTTGPVVPPIPTTNGPVPPTTVDPGTPEPPPTPDDCKAKENYGLTGQMLSASSSDSKWSEAKFGVFDTKSDDQSVGAWCAAYNTDDQYLQIEITAGTLVAGLKIQGRATSETDPKFHKFVTQFEIKWKKDDNSDLLIVDHLFKTNISDANKGEEIEFEVPIKARYLRIYPKSWQHQMCMRVDLIKCKI